jgi:PAS domain S-box-containing protein
MPHKKLRGYVLLISFDISSEIERLESLRYSEERFRQMIESSNQIFWIVEFNPRKAIYVSPAYEKIFNQPLEKIFENPNAYLECVHPDDVERIKNRYTDLEAETDDEYRIIDPEGSIRWLHSRTFPVKDPGGRIYRKCGIVEDITERREAGEQLKKERKALMEKNITLKEVLEHIEEEKRNFRLSIAENIQQIIMPTLRKIVNDDGTVNKSKLMVLENSLGEMALISGGLMHLYSRLSPREVEICTLIRNGATTKEIADALYISTSTVKKHREKIRKKLQITNRKTNLASYLKRV